MTTIASALNPALGQTRFGARPLSSREQMQRSRALCGVSSPTPACTGNIFVGMFFDGTGNNEDADFKISTDPRQQKHSNVVRLYHAHPDDHGHSGKIIVGTTGYYKYYIPGLGTNFKEIGDTAKVLFGYNQKLGSSMALNGAARVLWGLTRVFNAVSQYLYKSDIISDVAAKDIIDGMPALLSPEVFHREERRTCFRGWSAALQAKMAHKKPEVTLITVNVFGFSRGAAEARAFVNWLYDICEPKDGGWLFAGIPLRVQFLGIFDTVSSVGVAGVFSIIEGRQGWAADNMQVHPAVERCTHMVAGHEVRACFPLDSVRIDAQYPLNVKEYIYPGSHSDVGGGYLPLALGTNDWVAGQDHQLARIPGYEMFCVGLAAGVPFTPFSELEIPVALALKPAAATVRAFDAYYQKAGILPGPVEEMAGKHMSLYFTRRWCIGDLSAAPQVVRAAKVPNRTPGINEVKWLQDTQRALIYVIAGLCQEIDRRIEQSGDVDKPLAYPFAFDFGIKNSLTAAGLTTVPTFPYLKVAEMEVPDAHTVLARQQMLNQGGDALRKAILLACYAPERLKRWRKWIETAPQAEVHDLAVEREATRLLEALQSEKPLAKEVIVFLDDLVHDSMAGFIGFNMPEFQINGYGIAKFRRIFFGNNGDRLLKAQTAGFNEEQIAAATGRRKDRARWARETAEYNRMKR